MPVLNTIVGQFSVITGKTAGVLTTGLVAAFIALAPLARDAGVYVLNLSTRFAELMSGPGVVTFGDYVRSVFPQVMQAVESIVGAALRLIAALAPLGLGTLTILRVFTDVINALPVDVLSNLATVAAYGVHRVQGLRDALGWCHRVGYRPAVRGCLCGGRRHRVGHHEHRSWGHRCGARHRGVCVHRERQCDQREPASD